MVSAAAQRARQMVRTESRLLGRFLNLFFGLRWNVARQRSLSQNNRNRRRREAALPGDITNRHGSLCFPQVHWKLISVTQHHKPDCMLFLRVSQCCLGLYLHAADSHCAHICVRLRLTSGFILPIVLNRFNRVLLLLLKIALGGRQPWWSLYMERTMPRLQWFHFWFIFFLIFGTLVPASASTPAATRLLLHQNWWIQSSCLAYGNGEQISLPGYHPASWHPAEVPTTVLAALVSDNTYPHPFFAPNSTPLPGPSNPVAKNFAHLPPPTDSPYHCSWWYRTEFKVPADYKKKDAWLNFSGINYHANIWLNGKKIDDADQGAGAFRAYEFEVHQDIHPGETNALAVEVFAPEPGDLALNWADWNAMPPAHTLAA